MPGGEPFWQKQEKLAEISWGISSKSFPWPPVSARDVLQLASALRPQTLLATPYLTRSIASLIPGRAESELRTFIDAQLLISAQTTAQYANALYGSAALDLPRRGVNQVQGGIGALAKTLAEWISANGGLVLYRRQWTQSSYAAGARWASRRAPDSTGGGCRCGQPAARWAGGAAA